MMTDSSKNNAINIGIVLLPETQLLDVAGPTDVFSAANQLRPLGLSKLFPPYQVYLISAGDSKEVITSAGIILNCNYSYNEVDFAIDTLLIAGSNLELLDAVNLSFYDWLGKVAPTVRRLGSICVGAFVLAQAGLLQEQKVTTHWKYARELQAAYPNTQVEVNPFYLHDGKLYSSGGVTSGMDLALSLVEEDAGRDLAATVAKFLVLPLKRLGTQSQFGNSMLSRQDETALVKQVRQFLQAHIATPISMAAVAEHMSMSERNFSRVFRKEAGITFGAFLDMLRIEHAQNLLEYSELSLQQVAERCGFKSLSSLERLFLKHLELTPHSYRRSFIG